MKKNLYELQMSFTWMLVGFLVVMAIIMYFVPDLYADNVIVEVTEWM